jgi:vancomycin permeability regulator SanA
MQRLRRFLGVKRWWLVGTGIVLALLLFVMPVYATCTSAGKIYTVSTVPKHDVAVVFGAGVYPDGKPTPYLESRLIMAVRLYQAGKVKVLIMSGDNSTARYNEPVAMKRYAMRQGIPASKIVLDYAGYDTYDTCYRVHHLFGVSSAVLVSHGYHLPRALMTCGGIGIQSVGVKADRTGTGYSKNYLLREILSLNKAGVQLLLHSKPAVLGPKESSVSDALHG